MKIRKVFSGCFLIGFLKKKTTTKHILSLTSHPTLHLQSYRATNVSAASCNQRKKNICNQFLGGSLNIVNTLFYILFHSQFCTLAPVDFQISAEQYVSCIPVNPDYLQNSSFFKLLKIKFLANPQSQPLLFARYWLFPYGIHNLFSVFKRAT